MKVEIRADTRNLETRLRTFDERNRRVVTGVMAYHQGILTNQMKKNAPWTDDSGAARKGLHARLDRPGANEWNLICAHAVNYGIWLETKWMGTGAHGFGKYAVVLPTIVEWSPVIMKRIIDKICDVKGGEAGVMNWSFDYNE